jgi:hypothetical protein
MLIDPNWSPEQVMAVIELLDDLRERIWAQRLRVFRFPSQKRNRRMAGVSSAAC